MASLHALEIVVYLKLVMRNSLAVFNTMTSMRAVHAALLCLMLQAGNTKGGTITVLLTSCLTGLD